jgi:hypothetical protein
MPEEVRLWQVEQDNLTEIRVAKLNREERIETWIRRDISILDARLLVIGQQVETAFGQFIDLLCIDSSGGVVVVELKRDKTPREVTAQALDYASWIKSLNADQIEKLADDHLKDIEETLESAFRKKFDSELPDVLNEHHSLVIVASEIDDSTERIIRYLSEEGIAINAARFGFYQTRDGREFISRTFTVAPEEAEKSTAKGKRTITSPAEMERRADEAGVGDLYRECIRNLAQCFENHGTNKTAHWFSGATEDVASRKIILSVIPGPGRSSKGTGLRYQVYRSRLAEYVQKSAGEVLKHLPPNPEDYTYCASAPDDLRGWPGYSRNGQDIRNIVGLFAPVQATSARV